MKLEVGKWYFRNDFEYYCVVTSVEAEKVRYTFNSTRKNIISGLKMYVSKEHFLTHYIEATPLLQVLF